MLIVWGSFHKSDFLTLIPIHWMGGILNFVHTSYTKEPICMWKILEYQFPLRYQFQCLFLQKFEKYCINETDLFQRSHTQGVLRSIVEWQCFIYQKSLWGINIWTFLEYQFPLRYQFPFLFLQKFEKYCLCSTDKFLRFH